MAEGNGCATVIIGVPLFLIWIVVAYGIVTLVFRYAFGIQLPNPVGWLPVEWQHYIPRVPP
jgi:hypothetical protein